MSPCTIALLFSIPLALAACASAPSRPMPPLSSAPVAKPTADKSCLQSQAQARDEQSKLLASYQVGVTTQEQALKDWNAADPLQGKIGIVGALFTKAEVEIVLGASPFCDDMAARIMNNTFQATAKVGNGSYKPLMVSRAGNPNEIVKMCTLKFSSEILKSNSCK